MSTRVSLLGIRIIAVRIERLIFIFTLVLWLSLYTYWYLTYELIFVFFINYELIIELMNYVLILNRLFLILTNFWIKTIYNNKAIYNNLTIPLYQTNYIILSDYKWVDVNLYRGLILNKIKNNRNKDIQSSGTDQNRCVLTLITN